jgi:SAM-dependent methyltransferase
LFSGVPGFNFCSGSVAKRGLEALIVEPPHRLQGKIGRVTLKSETVSLYSLKVNVIASGLEVKTGINPNLLSHGDRYACHVWDTPHFALLKGKISWRDYENYVAIKQQPHSSEKFSNLISAFSLEDLAKNPITVLSSHRGGYEVQDGAHRLALYFFTTGLKTIPTRFILGASVEEIEIGGGGRKLKNPLARADSQKFSNGWFPARVLGFGYHGFELPGLSVIDQRVPLARLEAIDKSVGLSGKAIFDLGCSTGGMLLHMPNPARAIGWDFDRLAIKSAKLVTREISKKAPEFAGRFKFEIRDLDEHHQSSFARALIENNIDIVFLLSIGSWVSAWRDYYAIAANSGCSIVIETNNDEEGEEQLDFLAKLGLSLEEIISQSRDDNTGNVGRRTFLARQNREVD